MTIQELSSLTTAARVRLAEVLAAPNPTQQQPPGTDKINTMLGWMLWGGSITAFIGILIVAYQFMLSPNRHQHEGTSGLGKVGFGMLLVGAASGIVGAVLG